MKYTILFENAILVSIIIFQVYCQENNTVQNQDLLITQKEKLALDKFKERIYKDLPECVECSQFAYLIRWLRARNFDIIEAEKMLRKSLKWRMENEIDNILHEDFKELTEY